MQTGFLSDIYSILYIVSYLCGKSPCLTLTACPEDFGGKGLGGIGRLLVRLIFELLEVRIARISVEGCRIS